MTDLIVELIDVACLLQPGPKPFRADVTFDERLADFLRPVRHLLCEQAAVELDELAGQFVGERLVGVPGLPQLVELLRHIGVVVLMGRIQQEQGAYLAGEPLRVMARVQAAERMAGQQVGCGHAGGPQKLAQLAGHLGGGARQPGPVTPPRPGPVVEHARGELGGFLLDVQVVQADRAAPGQEHHRRGSAAGAVQQQAPAADLVEPPQRRIGLGSRTGTNRGRLVLHR